MIRSDGLLQNLLARTALLPGSRDRTRRPIVFVPFEGQSLNLSADQLRSVLCYLIDSTCENDKRNRFVFVVDMRHGATTSNLKLLLKILEDDFKAFTAMVLVVKSEKFWQNHKSSVTSGKYSYEVQVIQLDQLSKTIDTGQIIREFGGQLNYNHVEWLEIRKTIESIIVKINEILHRFEEYSIQVRSCLLPTDLNAHSPDQFFHTLNTIEAGLQAIRSESLDTAIDMLNEKLNRSTSHSQNPDFADIVPFLRQSAKRMDRAKKEVYDLLNAKRRELDRDSQLLTYESAADNTLKFIVSYADQISKVAFDIGKTEEQAKQLLHEHKDRMDAVCGIEPTYKHVLDQGQRLLGSNAVMDTRIERYLRPLKVEWTALHRKMEDRHVLLENALKFHSNYISYQKQANDWIKNAGNSTQPDILNLPEHELTQRVNNLRVFREKWEAIYSETLSCSVDLRKKLEHRNQSSRSTDLIVAAIDNIIRLNQHLNNVWESKNGSLTQRIQFLLLLPEIGIVIKWLDEHGEPFLRRKIAIGIDYKSAKSLADNHEKFCEIANQTYQNAQNLFRAAEGVVKHGDADVNTIKREVQRLGQRISRFTEKVDSRTRLLLLAVNFYRYYAEIIEYYGILEQRNKKIRVISQTQNDAEQNKENFQKSNDRCEQAYKAIMAKSGQLLEELEIQKQLLEVRNEEAAGNIQRLITTIEQKHMTEKGRWPSQREILKHAAYVSGFLEECEIIYEQILGWNNELTELPKQIPHQNLHIPGIVHYHKKNMANVEEAVKDALRRTIKIKDSIANMELVMQNNEPALDAVIKMGRKIQDLEENVMKVAREISEHFQWKKVVDKVEQEAEDLIKKIGVFAEAFRELPCLAFNASEVEVQNSQHKELQHKIEVLKELIITFELNVKRHEKEFIAIDLIQKLKYHLENVKMEFAHLIQILESRFKLIRSASQYYKCLANAIPAIDSIEKTYNYDNREKCVDEQTEELSKRLESIKSQIQAHRLQKTKFIQGLVYAIRCADQFNNRLRRFEDDSLLTANRLVRDHCRMLQTQVKECCDEIANRQTHLIQLWAKRNDDYLMCEECCLLEVLAKQIIEHFESKTAELQQKVPPKQISSLSSSEVETFMEILFVFERGYKSEQKKINHLKENFKGLYEHIRTSYHFSYVESSVKQVDEQSKRFEELLRNYHHKCTMSLGKANVDILSRNANANRHSDGSLEERISQQSQESNNFTVQDENAKKLREPMRELLASERDYIMDLQKCIDVYLRSYRMSENAAPTSLRCKEKQLFGNIEDLFQFHNNHFLDALTAYEQNPEFVGCCFYTYVEKLKDLYTAYILNNEENSSIINTTDVIQHFEAIQVRYKLEPNHNLQSMLIKPIQRITRYPMLLGQLMRYSTENKKEMQTALDKMLNIPREANDRVHLKNFEEADELRIGDFVMQDTFVVSEPKRYFGRDKERQVFLFESNIIFTKKEELPSKKIRYLCKYRYLLSDLHIVEHIEHDRTKFGLRKGSLPQGDHTTILKASSEESRKLWVIKIRELIMEIPIKSQLSENESNGGSLMSGYNNSMESVKKLSVQENQRFSTTSTESNAIKQTTNGSDAVEMRRPKNLFQQVNGTPFSQDNFLLPLDEHENHYENLMPELNNDLRISCFRKNLNLFTLKFYDVRQFRRREKASDCGIDGEHGFGVVSQHSRFDQEGRGSLFRIRRSHRQRSSYSNGIFGFTTHQQRERDHINAAQVDNPVELKHRIMREHLQGAGIKIFRYVINLSEPEAKLSERLFLDYLFAQKKEQIANGGESYLGNQINGLMTTEYSKMSDDEKLEKGRKIYNDVMKLSEGMPIYTMETIQFYDPMRVAVIFNCPKCKQDKERRNDAECTGCYTKRWRLENRGHCLGLVCTTPKLKTEDNPEGKIVISNKSKSLCSTCDQKQREADKIGGKIKETTIICTACQEKGHTKANKNCPKYAETYPSGAVRKQSTCSSYGIEGHRLRTQKCKNYEKDKMAFEASKRFGGKWILVDSENGSLTIDIDDKTFKRRNHWKVTSVSASKSVIKFDIGKTLKETTTLDGRTVKIKARFVDFTLVHTEIDSEDRASVTTYSINKEKLTVTCEEEGEKSAQVYQRSSKD